MVREAELQETDAGLVPASTGWFVMNARDARWFHRPGRGDGLPLTGCDEFEAETYFPMLGMSIQVLPPGQWKDTGRPGKAVAANDDAAIVNRVVRKENGFQHFRRRLAVHHHA